MAQLLMTLVFASILYSAIGFPLYDYELDIYDERIMEGTCPMVDCMMMDILLTCSWEDREPIYFTVNDYLCRGCMKCKEDQTTTQSGGEVTEATPTAAKATSGAVDVTSAAGQTTSGRPAATSVAIEATSASAPTTSGTVDVTPAPTQAPSSEYSLSSSAATSSGSESTSAARLRVTTAAATTTTEGEEETQEGEDEDEDEDTEEEEVEEERGNVRPNWGERPVGLPNRAWVDDSGILALGDDGVLLEEFLNSNDHSPNHGDGDGPRPAGHHSGDGKTQHGKNPQGLANNDSSNFLEHEYDEEEARIMMNCPLLDCAVIEYQLPCLAEDREPTFWPLNGIQCPGCRRCRLS